MHDPVRLGAVDYLNARPLVYGLELRPDAFALRFDVPSECARAARTRATIDLGMIPSIDVPARPRRIAIVPGVASGRTGRWRRSRCSRREPIARGPDDRARHVSRGRRTRCCAILCARAVRHRPGVRAACRPISTRCSRALDAALLIGDPALFLDHAAHGAAEDRPRRASGRR